MRNSLRLKLLGTALFSGVSLIPIAVSAQTNSSSVETVVVTAEKRSEEAKNVPMSLTVVGQDELNKLNIRSFEDLAGQVPGLSVSEADPTHPSLILRGLNAGGDGSTTGTYLDETPYGSSNGLSNAVDTAPNLDTYDMKQVLVLRGPQGTLYGADAEGGLIKFVTNAPDTSGFDDSFELGLSQMDHGGLGDSMRGMANVAITDDLAVRVVGYDVRSPGYIDVSGPGLNIRHANNDTDSGGRASVLYRPTDKLSIRLNFLEQQLDTRNDSAEDVIVENGKITPLFGDYHQMRTTLSPSGVRYDIYNATINYDFDFATFTSATSYTDLHDFTFADDTGVLGADVQGFLHQGRFIQEARLASDPGQGPLDWLVGFYYANEHNGLHQDVVTAFETPPSLESLNLQSTYVETAGFANATYHILSNFELGGGLRYATDNQNAQEGLTIPVVETLAGGVSSHSIITWSADARYHLDDDTMFYARVATGWRPGGPTDLPPGAPPNIPRAFNPDSVTNYETGVKSILPDENLSFDADVYFIQWRDIQLLELVDNFNIAQNGGAATSKGTEANVTWQPISGLTLNANAAFTDANLTQNAPGIGGLTGNALPYSPRWSGTLNGDYEFGTVLDQFTPYIGASWHYFGIRGGGFAENPATGNPIPEIRLPAYDTIDLRVGVSWDKWSLELYAKNLNNAKGIEAFAPFGGSAASIVGSNPLPAANASIIEPQVIGIVLRGKI